MLPGLYVPLAFLAAIVGMGLALFAWIHRDTPGGGPLALFLLASSILTLTSAVSLSVWGPRTVFWATLSYAISALLPLAWLLTVLEYAGKEEWLTPKTTAVLLVEPAVFSVLLWTNESHSLVWSETGWTQVGELTAFVGTGGLLFWGHLAYAYILVALGAAVLLPLILRAGETFRDQATALLAAVAVPMIVSAGDAFGLLPLSFDPTGMAFVLSGLVLAGAMFQDELLSVSPAARELGREQLADDLDDPVVIVDSHFTIVDTNPPANRLFDESESALVGRSLEAVEPALVEMLEGGDRGKEIRLERNGSPRYYDVSVSQFHRAHGTISGHIVSLRDVTERTRREQRLEVMNRLFRHNLRNEMNVVRGNAELIGQQSDGKPIEERADRIIGTVDEVIDRSDKLGTLARTLEKEKGRTANMELLLESAASAVREDHPEADITVERTNGEGAPIAEGGSSVEIALTELIENAVEHHHDPPATITASVRMSADSITVSVSDDGPGIPQHERSVIENGTETPLQHASGIGLWIVRWLVGRAGGVIEFEVEEGTTVTIRIPRVNDEAETSNSGGDESRTDASESARSSVSDTGDTAAAPTEFADRSVPVDAPEPEDSREVREMDS